MTDTVHNVTLRGVTFTPTGEGGVGFTSLTDWYGVPEARGDVDPIPGQHGGYLPATVVRDSRVITLEGAIHAPTRAELDDLRLHVSSALTGEGLMSVADSTGTWNRWVIVQQAQIGDPKSSARGLPITVDMLAPDPVRYSETLVSGPAGLPIREGGLILPQAFPWNFGTMIRPVAEILNTGAVPVLPRLIVQGSGASVTVHVGSQRLEFGPFAGELVFDSLNRSVMMNGQDVTDELLRRDWPVVAAGEMAVCYLEEVGVSPETVLLAEYEIGVW